MHDYYLSQSTLGILAAGVDELWHVLVALYEGAGSAPGMTFPDASSDPARAGVPPARVGLLAPEAWESAEPAARVALLDALAFWQGAGVEVVIDDAVLRELNALIGDTLPLTRMISAYESRSYLEAIAARDRGGLSPFALRRIDEGRAIGRADYGAALEARARIRHEFERLSGGFAAFVTLSASGVAPIGTSSTGDPGMAAVASVLGCPAVSIPLGELDGLPVGMQLVGRYGSDFDLLAAARWASGPGRPT